MKTVLEILETLESNGSRIFKEEILQSAHRNDVLKQVFAVVEDPYSNFYITKFKVPPPQDSKCENDDETVSNFLEFVTNELSTRAVTGNAARAAVEREFSKLSLLQQKWCQRILLKNLRCGVQAATVNKIWPGTVVGFSVQLAEPLKTRHEKFVGIVLDEEVKYPVRVEPKLDGLRCVVIKTNGDVTMFSRSGTVIETLPSIKSIIENCPWDNFALDCEAMGADWNESASVVMSRKKNKDDSNMVLHVFDAVPFEDWRAQNNELDLSTRVELVQELVSQVCHPSVMAVEGKTVTDNSSLISFYKECLDQGYEGIMVKDLSSPYVFKRSKSVKKMKPISTYEGVVVGSYTGNAGSKREGIWAGFEIKLSNGVTTRVGGGFTDKLKAEIELDSTSWLGRIVEVEGQPDPATNDGLTKDGKIRFPVFIRERSVHDVDSRLAEISSSMMT